MEKAVFLSLIVFVSSHLLNRNIANDEDKVIFHSLQEILFVNAGSIAIRGQNDEVLGVFRQVIF